MKQFQHILRLHTCEVKVLFLGLCLFILISFPRLMSLDAHWSSDEGRWLNRSLVFMSAVKKGEFSETLIAYHPGVMTMWIAGLRVFFIKPHLNVPVRDQWFMNLTHARWFIGIFVWAGIGIACLLVYRLFGRWVALVSYACFAYSPLFLAQTRRVHTDALATVFILLTVLLFLLYCENRQHIRYLLFSGIIFGLAVLSKSYALILLVWMPLCLILFHSSRQRIGERFSIHITEVLCFLNFTLLTVLAVWPVFWTTLFGIMALCLLCLTFVLLRSIKNEHYPFALIGIAFIGLVLVGVRAIQTVWLILDSVGWAVTTPHEVEHFFLGKVANDPGWLFYPFVLTINSTPLMLPLVFLGCFLLWKYRKNSAEISNQLKLVLAMVGVVILFTVCLSLTSKKFSRYLLPVFPILEILAAVGFVEFIRWGCAYFEIETIGVKRTLAGFACLCFFLIQILPVLLLHPYYGTYYNLCWKVTDITKIITVGDASGLDLAANYLNQKPNARRMQVQVSPLATEFVRYYFQGHAYRADRRTLEMPNYEIVYIRDSQIGRVPQTGTLNGELEHVITLNGIDYVWIYRI